MNPVVFPDVPESEGLTVYTTMLSEFAWKNRLVGSTTEGFLYVDDRVARVGHYEFHPKLLEWKRIQECRTSRHVSIKGFVFGLLSLVLAFSVFMAGWVKQTHTGPGVVLIPLVCGITGAALVFGAVRNRIVVTSSDASYHWTSEPLAYRWSLSKCAEAADRCLAHGVPVTSHTPNATATI